MEAAGRNLDPSQQESCEVFRKRVMGVQSALMFKYAIIAHLSIRLESPAAAADIWKQMVGFCEEAIRALWKFKNLYPGCGTPELYNLALDYRQQAQERYQRNLE